VTTTAFSPWRGELGSSCAADVFRYLLGCFRLRGGRVFDGIRWIYKVVREIAEATGYCERQVRRALVRLVQEGWIVREQKEKNGIAPGDGGFRRRYWYAPGPSCPVPLRGRPQCRSEADMATASSIPSTSTPSRTNPSKARQPQSQQPERGESRLQRAGLVLQATVAPLVAASSAAPGRLHSDLVREEWNRNPANRAGAGRGFAQ
jgi:hypothetical protein